MNTIRGTRISYLLFQTTKPRPIFFPQTHRLCTTAPGNTPNQPVKLSKSFWEKAKILQKKYGKVFICTTLALSAIEFASIYTILKFGTDIRGILSSIGMKEDLIKWVEDNRSVGIFGVTLVTMKVLSPIKVPIAVGLTPIIARTLRHFRLLK